MTPLKLGNGRIVTNYFVITYPYPNFSYSVNKRAPGGCYNIVNLSKNQLWLNLGKSPSCVASILFVGYFYGLIQSSVHNIEIPKNWKEAMKKWGMWFCLQDILAIWKTLLNIQNVKVLVCNNRTTPKTLNAYWCTMFRKNKWQLPKDVIASVGSWSVPYSETLRGGLLLYVPGTPYQIM